MALYPPASASRELRTLVGDITRSRSRVEFARIAFERDGSAEKARAMGAVGELLDRAKRIAESCEEDERETPQDEDV